MSIKTMLTIWHCFLAFGGSLACVQYAETIRYDQPHTAVLLVIGAAVAIALVATRVSWASGFEAGRRAEQQHATGGP